MCENEKTKPLSEETQRVESAEATYLPLEHGLQQDLAEELKQPQED